MFIFYILFSIIPLITASIWLYIEIKGKSLALRINLGLMTVFFVFALTYATVSLSWMYTNHFYLSSFQKIVYLLKDKKDDAVIQSLNVYFKCIKDGHSPFTASGKLNEELIKYLPEKNDYELEGRAN